MVKRCIFEGTKVAFIFNGFSSIFDCQQYQIVLLSFIILILRMTSLPKTLQFFLPWRRAVPLLNPALLPKGKSALLKKVYARVNKD